LGVEYAKDRLNQLLLHNLPPTIDRDELMKAIHLSRALVRNNEIEIDSLLNGLSGGFIPAAPGGDIIRDGVSILPTGRNIFALDPYRIPSSLAFIRGKQAAEMILKTHQAANNGFYPETVAVTLWGLDTIKTKVFIINVYLLCHILL
jgi:magnesium chelatase subunit H